MAVTTREGARDPAGAIVVSVSLLHGGDLCGRIFFEEAIFVSLTVFAMVRMRKRKMRP